MGVLLMLVVVAEVTPMMVAHVVVVGSWILCGGAHEITSLWSCEVRRKSLYAYKNVAAAQNPICSFEMA
jgi:hypothetical protein